MRARGALALLSALAACHDGSSGGAPATPLAPGVHDLGLEVLEWRFDGEWIVARVPEHGTDLNGDGDAFSDVVLAVVQARTGRTRTLPWAVQSFALGGACVSFVVPEFAQGGRDLNRDGDALDSVLFVHDLRSGATRNLGLALGRLSAQIPLVTHVEDLLVFAVSEAAQGETDLDGDGNADDRVVHLLTLPDGRVQSLGLPTRSAPSIAGRRIAIAVDEDGRRDRNGDGDALDQVLLVHDAALGSSLDLRRALSTRAGPARLEFAGDQLAFLLSEAEQGGVDLDGDGDALDVLLEIHDLAARTSVRTPGPTAAFWLSEELVVAALQESEPGATVGHDWNGDGDVTDQVAWLHDRLSGTSLSSGLALPTSSGTHATFPPPPALSARRAAFLADEVYSGGSDLNGDGDASDIVLQLFDGASGRVEGTEHEVGWGFEILALEGERLVFPKPDALADQLRRAFALDLARGTAQPLGHAVVRMDLQEERALLWVPELVDGADLDGNGRLGDTVLLVQDLGTGARFNTRLAFLPSPPWELRPVLHGDLLVLAIQEVLQGGDRNGDGDELDNVLVLVRLP